MRFVPASQKLERRFAWLWRITNYVTAAIGGINRSVGGVPAVIHCASMCFLIRSDDEINIR
jgi:hypothetical protein